MKSLILTTILIFSLNINASVLSETISKIEKDINNSNNQAAIVELDALKSALQSEGNFSEYEDIYLSLKALSTFQSGNMSEAKHLAIQALKKLETLPSNDPFVRKFKPVMDKIRLKAKSQFPFEEIENAFKGAYKVPYEKYVDDQLDISYDNTLHLDKDLSSGCKIRVESIKTNRYYRGSNGNMIRWKTKEVKYIDLHLNKIKTLDRFYYVRTNHAEVIRLSYNEDPKNGSLKMPYTVKTYNNGSIKPYKTSNKSPSYIDLVIGNRDSDLEKLVRITDTFKNKIEQCRRK